MEQKLTKLMKLLTPNPTPSLSQDPSSPQLGFKVTFCESSRQLLVKVIGARQLPLNYGSTKPIGYLVKITVFPCREKHETGIVAESWPTYNEEFAFTVNTKTPQEFFDGKFISFTVYSVLENVSEQSGTKQKASPLRRFLSLKESDSPKKFRRSFRHSLNSRRTVGAVTFKLEKASFTQKPQASTISTPDIWRDIKIITSGIQTEPREGKRGSAEVTLAYAVSEDGQNDVVEISVTKFRCSLQTMQEHEKLSGHLYIKISAFEQDDIIQKMKSDNFDATIALKIEHSSLRAKVKKDTIDQVKILIRLINKSMLGKKTVLGRIEIDNASEFWKEIVRAPGIPITRMISFE